MFGFLNKFKRKNNIAKIDYIEEISDFEKDNVFIVKDLNVYYQNGLKHALIDINVNIKLKHVTALIGPSGCGKSTFLRELNRMNEFSDGVIEIGNIFLNGLNINSKKISPSLLRSKVGMVFQKPTPFPISIYDNVVYGLRTNGIYDKNVLDKIVETSLKSVALWDEVKDNLDALGTDLSGGQQQRLCIARAIALEPEILLMDEPTSALDPISTSKIEELILQLKEKYTIIIVTHSMAQAQRVSDETIFFYKGKIIEYGKTKQIFLHPKNKLTKDYIYGRISE